MIKYFQKARNDHMKKNDIRKYLKYAIGEIFLVVVGILLAIEINAIIGGDYE